MKTEADELLGETLGRVLRDTSTLDFCRSKMHQTIEECTGSKHYLRGMKLETESRLDTL